MGDRGRLRQGKEVILGSGLGQGQYLGRREGNPEGGQAREGVRGNWGGRAALRAGRTAGRRGIYGHGGAGKGWGELGGGAGRGTGANPEGMWESRRLGCRGLGGSERVWGALGMVWDLPAAPPAARDRPPPA